MSVSTISPTLYRDNSSTEPPLVHITLRGSSASISSDYTRTGMSRAETSIQNSQGFEYYDMASATGSFSNNDPMDGNQSGANPELSASPALYFSPRSMSSRNSSPKVTTVQVAKRLFIDGVNKIKEYAPKSIEIFNFETNNGKQKESPRAESSKRNIRPQVIGNKSAKEVLESNVKATQERMRKGQDDTAPGWLPVPPPTFCNSWDQDPTEFLNKFCKHVNALEQILTLEETYTYLETFLEGRIKKTLTDLMVIEEDWEEYCKLFVTTCNKYRDTSEARKQFEKYNLYNNNPITTFADLKRLFRNMNVTDEEKMSEEVFKKLNPTDKQHMRNNKDGITMKTMLSYMIQREEDYIAEDKEKTHRYETPTKNSRNINRNINNVRCYKCRQNGHYANDCPSDIQDVEMKTATPINRSQEGYQREINLVDLQEQAMAHPTISQRDMSKKINAILGKVRINGIETWFQYDSGAATNLMSYKMAQKLKLGRGHESSVTIVGVEGRKTESRYYPSVKLTFDTFNIQVPMYSIEQGKPDLLLLGVDLLACLKAQINMDKQLISCNIKGQTHQIPLMLRHEEGKEITDDPKEINLIDVTGKVINQDLTELYKQRLENMLKENEDEFANNLEEFQGARVEPVKVELLEKGPIQCKPYRLAKRLQEEVMDQIVEMETQGVIGRIGRWILKLRHYDFDVVHREGKNNPADYLSRFPWEDIPEQIEEVLYISVHGYEELRNSLQDKKSSPDNNNILSKLSVQGKDIIHTDKEKRKYLHPNELYETIYNIHYEQHRDVAATYQYLNNHFYAPNSYPVVKLIVQRCEVCQRTNYIQRRAENLHPVIPSEPFRVWGLDVAGPINPATEPEGNRYIIMAVDYFTKWPVALPVKSVNAETICTFIVELIIANFGVPKMLITDRGTHLSNEACARFNEFLGIEQKPVTAYRPSANGQIERSIQTLKQLLIKQTISRPGCWDAYIWRSLLTMRTTPHRTLGRSPAEIVYGLKLLTPEVWNSYIPTDIEKTLAMRSRINYLENKIPTYRRLIIELAKKQKIFDEERYNRGVRKRNLEIGDKVLKATTTRNPYTMHRNVGPFTVINDLGNGVYEIEDRKGHVDKVHVDRLRKYFPEYEIIPNLVTGSTRTTGAYVSKKPTNIDLIEDDQELRGEMSNE
ncbi:Pro-Pol polyprotein [Zancudomyces culisetae]|uniref:Pro-Pol polyprotein n=1 Tax=Zancudomyces culisetae TaxID=1213189 RepID=A0A1R1PI05_ZANCU|nr:Pro-Pol polyprotein [Zancudomyces culisetae]|eukprot:OMH80614.1 Pro-Pol polyprotein [Zancudomyces culisetae]